PAISAAGPLDTIVARSGSYSAVVITKGVRIVADVASSPSSLGDITITNVPSNDVVTIDNVGAARIVVTDCLGLVILDSCPLFAVGPQVRMVISKSKQVHVNGFVPMPAQITDSNVIVTGISQFTIGPWNSSGAIPFTLLRSRLLLNNLMLHG